MSSGADVAFASVLSCALFVVAVGFIVVGDLFTFCALLVVAVGFSVVGDLSTFVLETPCTWRTSTVVSTSAAAAYL